MIVRHAALFGSQGLSQESFDLGDVLRRLGKPIDDRKRRWIQQVGVPGQRIEDGAQVAEVMHPQPGGCGEAGRRSAAIVALDPPHVRISDE